MRKVLQVLWRFGRAFIFYPVMIGLFLWLYVTDAHWLYGLGVIAAILIIDPIWRMMGRNALRMWRERK